MIDKEIIKYDFGKYEHFVAYLISHHQVSFGVFLPLWILGCLLIVSGQKSEKPRKILSETLKPVVTIHKRQLKGIRMSLVVRLVKYYVDIVPKVFALVMNCMNSI